MTAPTMVGNKNGIKLWTMMSTSTDEEEKSFFARLGNAASQYGKVYFTDCVTQRETKKNQVIWLLQWDGKKSQWEVSNFLTPIGASEVTERMKEPVIENTEEVVEVDIDDILE